jgi:hypothetical protein
MIALAVLALGMGDAARGEEPRMLATCLPVSQRTGPVGCWIMAQEALGPLPQTPLFWHLSTFPNRAAAEGAKGPGATVMEALDQVWVFGKEHRRSLVLILHETGKPASGFDTTWVPKGLCRD